MEAKVFKEFMNTDILLKYEDTPSISRSMFLQQHLESLEIDVSYIVHPSVYFTDVYPENS